ncbi:MAG: TetR/AcrR family transcriptional regulator [Sphingomonadales bacterium]|nr:TetR/AcrR family transcriptional regulator [Sphingomonadales bacterium]
MRDIGKRTADGYAQVREEKSADPRAIRTRLALEAALLALLRSRPFDSITPRDITDAAGLAYGTFYRHHPSKEAMLDELARREVAELYADAMTRMDAGGSRAGTIAFCRRFEEKRELWSALLNGGARTLICEELTRHSRAIALERAHSGDVLPWELSSAVANAAMAEIIAWWLRQDGCPIEFAADMIVRLVHDPIRRVSTSPKLSLTGTLDRTEGEAPIPDG